MKLSIAVITLVILALSVACGGSPVKVSADEYGAAWPLTVDKAVLHCTGDEQIQVVWMSAEENYYALTGFSQTYLNRHHPNLQLRPLSMVHRVGKDIGVLIQRAREACR